MVEDVMVLQIAQQEVGEDPPRKDTQPLENGGRCSDDQQWMDNGPHYSLTRSEMSWSEDCSLRQNEEY